MRRLLIELAILALLCFAGAVFAHETRNFSVIGKQQKDFVLMPQVAPAVWVRQVSGPAMPEKGNLNCIFKQESEKTPAGDIVHILTGYCEGGIVVHVTGIDLNN